MPEATPLTQEQVLSQLQVRGFESGFIATPLRDFWGVLKSITGEMRQGQSGAYLVALYNLEEIEVIESIEPYTSPIAQIDVSASTKDKSRMGYLGSSIDKIINVGVAPDVPQAQAKNFDSLIGKKLHWQFTPGHLIPSKGDDGVWKDIATNCWIVTEISGDGVAPASSVTSVDSQSGATIGATPQGTAAQPAVSASKQALTLLDGKNVQQWHQVVFTDPVVKQDTSLLNTFIDGSFLAGMMASGTVTEDESGVYHVVKE